MPPTSEFFCFDCLLVGGYLPAPEPEWWNDYFREEAEARFAWTVYSLLMHKTIRPFPGKRQSESKGAIPL